MEFRGILKERKPWVKVVVILLALYMLYIELVQGQWIYIPIVILIIIAALMDRQQVIDETGIDRKLVLLGYPIHSYWRWDEITAISADFQKVSPNVQLLFNKDVVIRSFVVTQSDYRAIVTMARKKNSRIAISDANKIKNKTKK